MNFKNYFKYCGAIIFIYVMLILVFKNVFIIDKNMIINHASPSIEYSIRIICNNMKNLLCYLIIFPLMPILLLFDLVSTSWAIVVSLEIKGVTYTFFRIAPHGIIEIPNFLLYSYISYEMMREFYKGILKKDFNLSKLLEYKKFILINIILVVIAGLIEGLVMFN
jgi:uncharacterized membrane protein SpoIIM required for sporulation